MADMIGALLRPGRFDEVVTFDSLDRELLVELLGTDADLADQLEGLPIAYVREFVARLRVLGRNAALEELAELTERVRAAASD
jgi:SpoVK/Ycf46/Vps4 family AAA+-type ATPase